VFSFYLRLTVKRSFKLVRLIFFLSWSSNFFVREEKKNPVGKEEEKKKGSPPVID